MNQEESLTVIATIIARSGDEGKVEDALRRLIPPTRNEPGCIQYDLHRGVDDSRVFVFVEKWRNRDLHAQHMAAAHLKEYQCEVDGLVESWDIKFLTRVG